MPFLCSALACSDLDVFYTLFFSHRQAIFLSLTAKRPGKKNLWRHNLDTSEGPIRRLGKQHRAEVLTLDVPRSD